MLLWSAATALTLVGSTLVVTRAQELLPELAAHPIGVFNPYNFQYSVDHPDGSQSSRVEKGDPNAVTGSYQILGSNGLQRTVNYIADSRGFRAFVDSNEPGVKSGEYPPPGPEVDEYQPARYTQKPKPKPKPTPAPAPPPPPPPIAEVVPAERRRVPASHQSQIRVQHEGATFSSHVDFGPADHAHDEHGNIIPLKGPSVTPHRVVAQRPEAGRRRGNAVASLYQETPVQGVNGQPLYEEFVPEQFSPARPLYIVGQEPVETSRHGSDASHLGPHGTRGGRRLSDVDAVSGVLRLNRPQVAQNNGPSARGERRRFPDQEPVSEQVAHSPTLYFNTANKEEEGGAIITKNNLNPPVKIFPPGSGIAQQGTPFRASIPQPQGHHPKNFPLGPQFGQRTLPGTYQGVQGGPVYPGQQVYPDPGHQAHPGHGQLLSVNVQPFDRRLGDLLLADPSNQVDVPRSTASAASFRPYEFGFSNDLHGHSQSRDQAGKVKGEYYLRGHDGQLRKVVYEAGKDGFRAHVDTNEFGIVSHRPTDAVINRTRDGKYNQVPTGNFGSPNRVDQADVFKPEKPLERGPRPTLYVGDNLGSVVNEGDPRNGNRGASLDVLPPQSYVPAIYRQEPAPIRTTTLAPPRIQNERPVKEDVEDLKRRPIHFVDDHPLVSPLPPKKPAQAPEYHRVPHDTSHPTTTQRPRQTFKPQIPQSRTTQRPSLQGSSHQDPQTFQTSPRPYVSTTVRPGFPHQEPVPRQDRGGRQFSGGLITQPGYSAHDQSSPYQQRHDVLNVSITEPRRLVDPSDEVQPQPGPYRQPHHGPGFGYQHTTVHDPVPAQVPQETPQFNRLDVYQQPSPAQLPQQPKNASRPGFNFRSQVPPPQQNQPIQSYTRTQNNAHNVNGEQVPELTFRPRTSQSFPPNSGGNENRWQNSGHFNSQPQTGVQFPGSQQGQSVVQPARPFDRNEHVPDQPNQFESHKRPHQQNVYARENPSNARSISRAQHSAARAFGEPVVSPNLKVPASEAIRTGPGVDVTPAPIKHFGPPGATPLPPSYQATQERTPHHQISTSPTPRSGFSSRSLSEGTSPNNRPNGRERATTPARGSRNLDPSRPLLRMYDNGVVIGGPEPQKISYDPINDEPARQGKSLRNNDGANTLHSGYASRNFFPSIIYNSQDQQDHFSDFSGQTDAPNRDARLLGETVTPTQPDSYPSRQPFTPTTISPTPELKSFSPASNANLMSFEVKKVTRRRRRRKQNRPVVETPALYIPPPPPASSNIPAEFIPAPVVPVPRDPHSHQPYTRPPVVPSLRQRSRPVPAAQPPSPLVTPFPPVATSSRRGTHTYNNGIPFGTRLRPGEVYIPQAREIALNNYAYSTPPAVVTFHNRPEDGGTVRVSSDQASTRNRQPSPPPKRRITRRRRLKSQHISSATPVNPDQVYPNLPTYTPAPANFGFSNGVPQLRTPYDRPHFRSGANANLPSLVNQRRQKSLFTTTNNPLDLTPDLKQERQPPEYYVPPPTEPPTTTHLPVQATSRPHLPGFPASPPSDVSTASLIDLVHNQPSLPSTEPPSQSTSRPPVGNSDSVFGRSHRRGPDHTFGNENAYTRLPGVRQEGHTSVSGNRNIGHAGPPIGSTYEQIKNRQLTGYAPDARITSSARLESTPRQPAIFGNFGPPRLDPTTRPPDVGPRFSVHTPTNPIVEVNGRADGELEKTTRQPKRLSLPRFKDNFEFGAPAKPDPRLQSDLAAPSPYKFGFDDRHSGGARVARHEEFDGTGRVTGFYTIEDPDGRKRLVKYVADEHGFRASVVTNEQGTDNQDPAQIRIRSTSPHYVPKTIDTNPDSTDVQEVAKS